jgi:hypothetical protein
MSFKIEYFSPSGKHITLNSDGSIEIYQPSSIEDGLQGITGEPIKINYPQSKILKSMIIAEYELEKGYQ